ncbi:hypothetical protein E2493_06270 [Sphingomonas parva]|uniref:Uncharacterized protein n=1 Tax=Sphingomonas parva TaxID=2555898 RepID=A0A4Y8ZUI2_9SPHN|nr:hypothetical protein [Sphingomonas parva]TFI59127.1 hypothetical protein E2493_06270 [Sphingomonas parva]
MGMDTSVATRGRGWRIGAWSAAAALLLAPALAMQMTDEVRWGLEDFAVAAALILAVGVPLELAVRMTANGAYRVAAAVALGTGFLLVWSNLAVGFIGSEDNPANLLIFGVVGVAIAGAVLARFRARGMALAMLATALAQALAAGAAAAAGWAPAEPGWPREIALLTLVFCGLWLIAAALFRRAARAQR